MTKNYNQTIDYLPLFSGYQEFLNKENKNEWEQLVFEETGIEVSFHLAENGIYFTKYIPELIEICSIIIVLLGIKIRDLTFDEISLDWYRWRR